MKLKQLIIEIAPWTVRIISFTIGLSIILLIYWIGGGEFIRQLSFAFALPIAILSGIVIFGLSSIWSNKDIKDKTKEICDLISECEKEL